MTVAEKIDVGACRHGGLRAYRMGCRCKDCCDGNEQRLSRNRGLGTPDGPIVEEYTFGFCCPNCGAACQHINSSQPRPDLNQRSTALAKCTRTGCRRTWQLILVVQPVTGADK